MIIKKLVVGSLFSMLLVSEMAAADWGDVYYCQMTNFIGITLDGEHERYKLTKFKFKLDQTKNAIVFGSKGYFTDKVYELGLGMLGPTMWKANLMQSSTTATIIFMNGMFLHTYNGLAGANIISADCEKF